SCADEGRPYGCFHICYCEELAPLGVVEVLRSSRTLARNLRGSQPRQQTGQRKRSPLENGPLPLRSRPDPPDARSRLNPPRLFIQAAPGGGTLAAGDAMSIRPLFCARAAC